MPLPTGSSACYPFYESDPFFLEEAPDVLFVGNQPTFETRLVQGKLWVCCSPFFVRLATFVICAASLCFAILRFFLLNEQVRGSWLCPASAPQGLRCC